MIFGGVARERLQLNEDTLYAGGPYDPSSPDALAALPRVRELINAGKYAAEAQDLAQEKMMGRSLRMPSYQTVGDLVLTFGASSLADGYRRELDLDTALSTVQYTRDGVTYTRETFATAEDQVDRHARQRQQAGRAHVPGFIRDADAGSAATSDGDMLVLAGVNTAQQGIAAALRYEARVKMIHQGGELRARDGELMLEGADAALLLISVATSFRRYDDVGGDPEALNRARLDAASAKRYPELLGTHRASHRIPFRALSLDLGRTAAADLPTDERIRDSQKNDDPQLATLYFQYARYLLICCSRPGTQPANLQGLWNDKLGALGFEVHHQHQHRDELLAGRARQSAQVRRAAGGDDQGSRGHGARTARVNYGARGWVAHHNTDLWRATAPIDGAKWGMWPTGGAWLCKHLWDHYDYGRDRAFLADVYPAMKGAAQFFLDTLVPDASGQFLVTSPSMSPENNHQPDISICAGPAMDRQILRDLFANCIAAAEVLGVDADFRAACARTRAKLPPDRIGKAGQLQEWMEDWDMEVPEPHHRHVSHLYAVYPSDQITLRRTPELAAAAKKSLELRGDLSTGWAIAWRINLWARLREAERTHEVIKLLLDPSRTYPNMFDAHPPFQIDGNFGGASGICEMLLQCVAGEIELLPALPKAWATGSVRGLRARGGFWLEMSWRDGKLAQATVLANVRGEARLRYGDRTKTVKLGVGKSVTLTPASFL